MPFLTFLATDRRTNPLSMKEVRRISLKSCCSCTDNRRRGWKPLSIKTCPDLLSIRFGMSVIQTHLNKNFEGEITCPKCGKTRSITAAFDLIMKPAVNIKCPCGHRFAVSLDRRMLDRKRMCLTGTLYPVDSNQELFDVTITSLSSNGLSFETNGVENLAIGSSLEIEFPLGDSGIVVREPITIKHLNHSLVGAEFCQAHYDPESGVLCI